MCTYNLNIGTHHSNLFCCQLLYFDCDITCTLNYSSVRKILLTLNDITDIKYKMFGMNKKLLKMYKTYFYLPLIPKQI